jgi:ribosome-interacting GTPase 1
MPTNLPPEYYEVETRYKAASTPEEKITTLEELISTIPKHKGTDKLRANLRRRLSKLKSSAQTQKGVSRQVSAFHISKEGAGQVVIIGMPNVGKSALITALTNASPEVANYPFTTWTPTPGMMEVNHVQIQLIDTPPLNREYIEPALMDLIRKSDLMLIVVDLQTDPISQLENAVQILDEYHIAPCGHEERCGERHRYRFLPIFIVVNKNDDADTDEDFEVLCQLLDEDWPFIPVSATTGRNLEQLKKAISEKLEIIRVYAKPPGSEADLTAPYVLKKGSTVEDFAGKVHQDFLTGLKSARIWGSATFDGQLVGRDHVLQDGDVVELRI